MSLPSIQFVYDNLQLTPQHYEIVADSAGRLLYSSRSADDPQEASAEDPSPKSAPSSLEASHGAAPSSADGLTEDTKRAFTLSPATSKHIFELAKAAHYFEGDFDYKKGRIAFTGQKTLTYADKNAKHSASYNWSENTAIDELTNIFEGISTTLEAGPRLEHLLRYDRLGLNAELAALEQSAKNRPMRELHLISDVLEEILKDGNVMGLARHRAERLLQQAQESKP